MYASNISEPTKILTVGCMIKFKFLQRVLFYDIKVKKRLIKRLMKGHKYAHNPSSLVLTYIYLPTASERHNQFNYISMPTIPNYFCQKYPVLI